MGPFESKQATDNTENTDPNPCAVPLLAPDDRRALALGLVGLVRGVPVIAFSLLSGVAADALDRRRLMIVTQSMMACLALVLATLTFRGLSSLWPIYVLAACSSAAGAFDLPARQSLTPNLVPRDHLPNAITLNTIMVQVASVAGPALGGVVIATGGAASPNAGVVPRSLDPRSLIPDPRFTRLCHSRL